MSPAQALPWRRTGVITAVAIAAYAGIRALPLSGGSLHYTDFDAGSTSFLEFCEPGSPQFAPVDRVRSPVTLTLRPSAPARAGESVEVVAILTTSTGKPLPADDLLVVHTEKLHLLLVDPTLDEYHHVHPRPTSSPGEYAFSFTPRGAGRFRVFADFVPRPTGRGLYAGASLDVADAQGVVPAAGAVPRVATRVVKDGVVFELTARDPELRINTPADLELRVAREDGGVPVLEEVMGAKAHLVAFDVARSGFAHLHPKEAVAVAEDGAALALGFSLIVPDPGHYRLWAQLAIEGREVFVPFGLSVVP